MLQPTPAEQIRQFKDRLTNLLKRWKLSYEKFRNRSRWVGYEIAIEDMMEKFTILIEILGKGLFPKPRALDPKIAEMAKQLFDLA